MTITSAQIRMARAALALTVRELGELSGVHFNTVTKLESGEPIKGHAAATVQRALEQAGIEFLDGVPDVRGPGVAIKLGVEPVKKRTLESKPLPTIDDSTLDAWPMLSPIGRYVIRKALTRELHP
jgi:transcriptional regulator with XRE-family HTH domain